MLYECDQLEPSPPAEWLSHLDDCTQQAYWMRGVTPAAWTGIPERVSEGLLEHVEAGGLWAETEKVDGAQFYFGVDASGGSRSKDPRTRLCSWGISAVALNATGESVAAPRASSVALLAESAPPFWLQGFKTDVQQSICDLRVSLATESRAQHEELKRHLDDNLRTMQIQTDAKFAALETRLEALERDYHRRPDPESPRSVGTPTSGSPCGGQGLARGVFDPSDSTFEMVVGGFDQDKRVDIATSLQILYEDEELKEIVASHRCDFRDNKALIFRSNLPRVTVFRRCGRNSALSSPGGGS